jgi:RNA polymerase sigma-70 factor (ECF subfamily)
MVTSSEQVWTAMRNDLGGFFRRRSADPHTVDDLIAETFLRVHSGLDSVRDDERVDAWVWRVARSVLADHRRRLRGEALDTPELVEDAPQDEQNFNAEVNSWLESFLGAQLTEEHRQAVELADVQGLAQAQIAEQLGLSLTATKSRIQRGRERLRELVAACCHVEFDKHQNVVSYQRRTSGACCESKLGR